MTQPNQGQWGPPPNQGGYGPPPPGYGPQQGGPQGPWGPPQKKKHTVRNVILGIIGLIVVIVIISSVASGGGSKKNDDSTAKSQGNTGTKNSSGSAQKSVTDHSEDVKITKCAKDPTTEFPTATVSVTNNSSKASDYSITVAFESSDGKTQYDTGLAAVSNLAPGQSTSQDASSLKTDVPSGFTCKVASADRLSAVG